MFPPAHKTPAMILRQDRWGKKDTLLRDDALLKIEQSDYKPPWEETRQQLQEKFNCSWDSLQYSCDFTTFCQVLFYKENRAIAFHRPDRRIVGSLLTKQKNRKNAYDFYTYDETDAVTFLFSGTITELRNFVKDRK